MDLEILFKVMVDIQLCTVFLPTFKFSHHFLFEDCMDIVSLVRLMNFLCLETSRCDNDVVVVSFQTMMI